MSLAQASQVLVRCVPLAQIECEQVEPPPEPEPLPEPLPEPPPPPPPPEQDWPQIELTSPTQIESQAVVQQ